MPLLNLPREILERIISHLAYGKDGDTRYTRKSVIKAMLTCKAISSAGQAALYSVIDVTSCKCIMSLSSLVDQKPDLGRLIRQINAKPLFSQFAWYRKNMQDNDGQDLRSSTLISLSSLLQSVPNLERLSGPQIGQNSGRTFLESLAQMKKLRSLQLSHNAAVSYYRLSTSDVAWLLAKCSALLSLSLCGRFDADKDPFAKAPTWVPSASLLYLSLDGLQTDLIPMLANLPNLVGFSWGTSERG